MNNIERVRYSFLPFQVQLFAQFVSVKLTGVIKISYL